MEEGPGIGCRGRVEGTWAAVPLNDPSCNNRFSSHCHYMWLHVGLPSCCCEGHRRHCIAALPVLCVQTNALMHVFVLPISCPFPLCMLAGCRAWELTGDVGVLSQLVERGDCVCEGVRGAHPRAKGGGGGGGPQAWEALDPGDAHVTNAATALTLHPPPHTHPPIPSSAARSGLLSC